MADAINVMVYTTRQENGKEGFAIWIIFAREDTPRLSQFLIQKFGGFDPISDGDIQITEELLAEIWSTCQIRPYIIHQRAGQAVIIPALAPHYVCGPYRCRKYS